MGVLEDFAATAGVPLDQMILMACTWFAFVLAEVYSFIPQPAVRATFNLVWGVAFMCVCFGWGTIHTFVSSTLCYLVVRFIPLKNAQYVCFAVAMGYLVYSHISRMFTDYLGWSIDYSVAQMILTVKLAQFGCNLFDGQRPLSELSEEERVDRITKMPSVLEFYSYVYFFPTSLVGPPCPYVTYRDFLYRPHTPRCPTSFVLMKVLKATLTYTGILAAIFYPVSWVLSDEFAQLGLMSKLGYVYVSVASSRFKYYWAWQWAEACCMVIGISWGGQGAPPAPLKGMERVTRCLETRVDKAGNRWDVMNNVSIFKVEFAQNAKMITDNWNTSVGRWLNVYIYKRWAPKGKRPGQVNVLITQMVSAFWHGFYPGYYLFFGSSAFITNAAREGRRLWRPLFTERYPGLKPLYDVVTTIATVGPVHILGIAFVLLEANKGIAAWRQLYFLGQIIPYGGWIIFFVANKLKPQPKKNKAT